MGVYSDPCFMLNHTPNCIYGTDWHYTGEGKLHNCK